MHDALLYDSDEQFVDGVVPFIRRGLAAREPVLVATNPHNTALLREALGADAYEVHFGDNADFYKTPARTIAQNHERRERMLADGARNLRVVGEVAFGESYEQQLDWLRYEAMINRVFAHAPQWSICPYDKRRLPSWIVGNAARTHPHVRRDGERAPSDRYEQPGALVQELSPPPPRTSTSPAFELRVDRTQLPRARREFASLVRTSGADPERVTELSTGLNELVTNAVQHGGARAVVRCWREGGRVVCEVADQGPGLADPLAGYFPPAPEQLGGRGLWLARQIFDTVEVRNRDRGGLFARVAARI